MCYSEYARDDANRALWSWGHATGVIDNSSSRVITCENLGPLVQMDSKAEKPAWVINKWKKPSPSPKAPAYHRRGLFNR